jgi:DNA-binding IclR family transcriptional regulator
MRRRSIVAAAAVQDHAPAGTVDSLQRGLEALRCFQSGEDLLATSELARRLGLPRPTTRRLLDTLAAHGFLLRAPQGDAFGLHVSSFVVGQAVLSGSVLVRKARPVLQALADRFSVHALLCVGDRRELLVLAHMSGLAAQPWLLGAGGRLPVAETAVGRAWLWAQPPAVQSEYVELLREGAASAQARPKVAAVWQAFHDIEEGGACRSGVPERGGAEFLAAPMVMRDGSTAAVACARAAAARQGRLDAECAAALREAAQAIRDQAQSEGGAPLEAAAFRT